MKYIVVNKSSGSEGIAFLQAGRAGIPSAANPPRLYEAGIEAEKHARLMRSMLGGEWRVEAYAATAPHDPVELAVA